MALPPILLREFQSATISDYVPGKLASKYQQLETLAFGILLKDSKGWNVHFHFEDGLCEGKALPFLWNSGAYFDEECLKGGKLHLFAHFEHKSNSNAALHTPATSTAPSFSRSHTEAASRTSVLPSPTRALNDVSLPLGVRQGSAKQPGLSVSIPRKQQSNIVQNLSDSDSDGSDETHYLLSPSNPGGQSNVEGGAQSAIEPLPVNATAAQHALDFQQLLVTNAPKGKYGHKDNWDDIAKEYKAKITHAKLIKGIYGSPAPTPCEYCTLKNVTCRIYHPSLKSARAMPGSCGECRLRSNTCVVNGNKHRKAARKRKATDEPDNALDGPPSKILRRGVGGTPTGNADHCPVVTCSRRSEPFFNKANFFRHVRAAHPDYDMSRLDGCDSNSDALPTQSGRGVSGTFNCPVDKHCLPITRSDNFRRHVRTKHSDSIHAHVLEAFAQKKRITLPNPPSSAEFTMEFDKATSDNAPPGSFGHRQSSQWSSADTNIRTRIAHAKLIHGKYGVLAPESCGNCKKRGTACMVYHPHLDGGGRALGTDCGECRDRSVKCEIGAYPFAKILASADGIDRDEDRAQEDAIAVRVEAGQDTAEQILSKEDALGDHRSVMKQEEAKEYQLAAAPEHQNNDHDSVIDDEDPLSPIDTADDAEGDIFSIEDGPNPRAGFGGDEPTTDTAFYQYSKYADQHGGIARS